MNEPKQKQYLFDNPRNVSRLLNVFYILCIILFVSDFLFHRHVSNDWESLTGFYAFFGFVACVVLVLVAKQMRKVLMRKEDYYDVGE